MGERLSLLDGHLSKWLTYPWCAQCGSHMVTRDCDSHACVKVTCERCGAVTILAGRVALAAPGRPL